MTLDDRIPPGFERVGLDGFGYAWARPEGVEWVRSALQSRTTLHARAERDASGTNASSGDALSGRGPIHRVGPPATPAPWVVRHYFRGGGMQWLGDRYLATGTPRPIAELHSSLGVEALKVRTPRVVAAAVYPAAPFYRGDLVTEWMDGTVELAALLFGPKRLTGEERALTLRRVVAWVGAWAGRGLHHADLNAKNILIEPDRPESEPILLDLDRCHISRSGDAADPKPMLDRLVRSLRKFEARTGAALTAEEWRELA